MSIIEFPKPMQTVIKFKFYKKFFIELCEKYEQDECHGVAQKWRKLRRINQIFKYS